MALPYRQRDTISRQVVFCNFCLSPHFSLTVTLAQYVNQSMSGFQLIVLTVIDRGDGHNRLVMAHSVSTSHMASWQLYNHI